MTREWIRGKRPSSGGPTYVTQRPGIDMSAGELHGLCAERLAKYKRPALIEVLGELPKNPVGKIDKPALRALATSLS